MILVAVDDLLFSSKIRATAKQVGVELTFARTYDDILAQVQAHHPPVVIFDLNSGRTDPIRTIAAIKADPGLASTKTIGFASHVHTDLIFAARQAGIDDVMARSAFVVQLPDILAAGGSTQP